MKLKFTGVDTFARIDSVNGRYVKMWLLRTIDGRSVYRDSRGSPTLEEGSNMRFEFIEGQHPHGDRNQVALEVGEELVIQCVWEEGPFWESR